MQDSRDESSRKGGMKESRDAGKEGCGKGGMQERSD